MSSQSLHVLRLSQFAEPNDTFRIEMSLDGAQSVRTPAFKIGVPARPRAGKSRAHRSANARNRRHAFPQRL